jgi:transcriptional regulator with XRE-family HTH domain
MQSDPRDVLLKELGDRIIGLRRGEGWTRMALAIKLGVKIDRLGRWERGERQPPFPILVRLEALFGVSMHELVLPGSISTPEVAGKGEAV